MSTFPPMPRRALTYTLARVAEDTPPPLIRRLEISGIDPRLHSETTHLPFDLDERLQEVLALDDPSLPFTGNPLPDEPHYARESMVVPPGTDTPVRVTVPATKKDRERARMAALRKQRHLRLLEAILELRAERLLPRNVVNVAEPGDFDFTQIEDRDYALDEVVGANSRFRLRQVYWSGKDVRVIASTRRAVTILAGRAQGFDWLTDIINPVNAHLEEEAAALRARNGPNNPLVLSAGVGTYFNERKASETPMIPLPREIRDRAADALASMNLLSTVPMKRLVSFGNGLVETYCKKSARLLKAQKNALLEVDPDAYYPCDTSDFSVITFELGGPHRRTDHRGMPRTYEPGSWTVLTALGQYDPSKGGMIILWDLGWVITFAPGDTILLPAGVIRYSFVAVRPGETRYSMIQSAGNGDRDDITFAESATEAEHVDRERLRREMHCRAIGSFPRPASLPTGKLAFDYTGINPLY
ncbi:hypothetical protein R3P38DRAFT_3215414 [Favolaschia claudopus]|uniref:Uncharacterized protein n=1 Tax=Favolaschia claudopus TaxID=2862362 RepID=A0AAW0A7V5_9AGAR